MTGVQPGDPALDDDRDLVPIRGGPTIAELLATPPALAIAGLILSSVDMLTSHLANVIGTVYDLDFERESALTSLRADSGVQLGIAVLALILAVAAALRLRPVVWIDVSDDDDDLLDAIDEQSPVQAWVKALAGAALLVSVIVVILSAVAFGFALSADTPAGGPFS